MSQVRNWGRTLAFSPKAWLRPRRETEIVALVTRAAEARERVRVMGAGHSWTPLIETSGYLVSLDKLEGLLSLQPHRHEVTLWAGTRLHQATRTLWKEGYALSNQGDIDRQSIAGAFSTGTHGTGKNFGILATQAVHYRFIDGHGQIHDIYADTTPELYRALQVSLGLLGIITQVTLKVEKAYYLRLEKRVIPFAEALENFASYLEAYRHVEFFWFPYSDRVGLKLTQRSEVPGQTFFLKRWVMDGLWENGAFWVLNKVAQYYPSSSAALCRFAGRNMGEEVRIDRSYKVFATARWVRFREMEYGVPAEAGPEVLKEIDRWIRKHQPAVSFPIEYRYVKGDDIPLSPAYGGDRVFIAVHAYYHMPYEAYFRGIEEIFQAYGGRPHWGKLHTASPAYIAGVYPELPKFLALCERYDPQGIFRTPYFERLLWGERHLQSVSA